MPTYCRRRAELPLEWETGACVNTSIESPQSLQVGWASSNLFKISSLRLVNPPLLCFYYEGRTRGIEWGAYDSYTILIALGVVTELARLCCLTKHHLTFGGRFLCLRRGKEKPSRVPTEYRVREPGRGEDDRKDSVTTLEEYRRVAGSPWLHSVAFQSSVLRYGPFTVYLSTIQNTTV